MNPMLWQMPPASIAEVGLAALRRVVSPYDTPKGDAP